MIGAVIQARMNSQRLPGKVLQTVGDKSLLQYVLERVKRCKQINEIVIATSLESGDDPVSIFCQGHGVGCYRGSLFDVASRFNSILMTHSWDAVVRINGDSPLLDQHLIDSGISYFAGKDYDLVTNVFPRTYPRGQSVEIIRASTFKRIYPKMRDQEDLEHVTRFFYHNSTDFHIFNFSSPVDYSAIPLSVDTPEDLHRFSQIVSKMSKSHWEYKLEDVIRIYQQLESIQGETNR